MMHLNVDQLMKVDPAQPIEARLQKEHGSLDLLRLYKREVAAFPVLSQEEEIALGQKMDQARVARQRLGESSSDSVSRARLRQQVLEGKQAERRLIESNLRLVVDWAERFQGQALELLDLIQEGSIGLVRAARKFDHTRGCEFSYYCYWQVRQRITRAANDHSRMIRVPTYLAHKAERLLQLIQRQQQKLGRDPTIGELVLASDLLSWADRRAIRSKAETETPLSADLKEKLEDARQRITMMLRVALEPVSLDMPLGPEADAALGDLIEDDSTQDPLDAAYDRMLRERIRSALSVLTPRERTVLEMRFGLFDGKTHTLEEVGHKLDLTRARIHQIEGIALRRLRYPRRGQALREFLG